MAIVERVLECVAGSELVVVLGEDSGRDEMSGDGVLSVGECAGESVVAPAGGDGVEELRGGVVDPERFAVQLRAELVVDRCGGPREREFVAGSAGDGLTEARCPATRPATSPPPPASTSS